jgi:hypothetical protein
VSGPNRELVEALSAHVAAMNRQPLSHEDVVARFILYSSVMGRTYHYSEGRMLELMKLARENDIVMVIPAEDIAKWAN